VAVFDLHIHTTRGSSDSSLAPEDLARQARDLGLDGVCLTEHSGGWEQEEVQRAFEGSGLVVVNGLEVETDMGHILVFGLHSYLNGMHRVEELRKAVDEAGGVMVSAHPFRNLFNQRPFNYNLLFRDPDERPESAQQAASHPLFELVDAIEVANGSNTDYENRFALDVAQRLGLAGTGGSDAHSLQGIGSCVTVFDGDVKSESDLVESIKAKAHSPGQGLHQGQLTPFAG